MNQEVDFNSDSAGFQPSDPILSGDIFTAQPSDLSVMDRIIAIFSSPREALQGIELVEKKSSLWMIPLLISMVVGAASFSLRYYTTPAAQEEHQQRVETIEKLSNNKQMPAEQRAKFKTQAAEDVANASDAAVKGAIGGFLLPAVVLFLSGLVFFIVGRFIFGAQDLTYSMILVAGSLTMLLSSVGDLLNLLLQSVMNSTTASISPAMFSSASPRSPIFVFLLQINPFKIWDLIVFSLALASLSRKSNMSAYLTVFITWGFRIAILTGLTALAASFTG
jgi:hypothetical protein